MLTTEEKVKHIAEVTLENTQRECDKSLGEYMARLDKQYDAKKAEAQEKAQLRLENARESLAKQAKRECANEQICLKRELSSKQSELRDVLKQQVIGMLLEYTGTDEYLSLLEHQINEAVKLAAGNCVNIYIDFNDEDKKEILEKKVNIALQVNGNRLIGGIVAEIPAKNILIDNSFATRLETIMEDYTFKV